MSWSPLGRTSTAWRTRVDPVTVGAAPVQNIGAYGVELHERLESLDAIDLRTGRIERFDSARCEFGYRDSVFKRDASSRYLIVSVRFRLGGSCHRQVGYADLRACLESAGKAPERASAAEVAEAVRSVRRRKLPDPAAIGNAGSFFKNLVVGADQAAMLAARHP
ncbi:MAG: hypothetical protein R3E48_06540 [Burkholderiaceae bacterium]